MFNLSSVERWPLVVRIKMNLLEVLYFKYMDEVIDLLLESFFKIL